MGQDGNAQSCLRLQGLGNCFMIERNLILRPNMQKPSTQSETKMSTRKPIPFRVKVEAIILAILVIAIAIPFANDLAIKAQLAPLNAVAGQFDDYLNRYGAVEIKSGEGVFQNSYGLNFITRCGVFSECPGVGRRWYVPVDPGKAKQFVLDMLKNEGWTTTVVYSDDDCEVPTGGHPCGMAATKGEFKVGINISSPHHSPIPDKNIFPKLWRSLDVQILRK